MDVLLYLPLEERVKLLLSAGKEIAGYAGRLQKHETGTVGNSEKLLADFSAAESSKFADWFDGKKIDEIALCEYLLRK